MTGSERDSARARVAWLSADGGAPAGPDLAHFADAGWRISLGAGATPVDLAIVDLGDRAVSPKAIEAMAATVRRAAPECVLVFRASATLSPPERAHLRRVGELVLSDFGAQHLVALSRNRLRLRNIAEETGERLKSLAATSRLAEFPPIECSAAAPSILVAGAPSPIALAAFTGADGAAGAIAGALTPPQAMRALEHGRFDVVVLSADGPNDPLAALARTLRCRRRWQDLPFLVVAPGSPGEAAAWASGFAADLLRKDDLVEELPSRAVALARRSRLSHAMRRFLHACAGEGVRDRLSGAFASPFFALHGERVFARADASGRAVALVGVRLHPPHGDEAAATAKTLTEAARLIRRVTRAEDFVARLAHDTFIVTLPATIAEDAALVAARIEGVVGHAMFQSPDDARPYSVAASAVASARPRGLRLEEAVAGVLAELNSKAPKRAEL